MTASSGTDQPDVSYRRTDTFSAHAGELQGDCQGSGEQGEDAGGVCSDGSEHHQDREEEARREPHCRPAAALSPPALAPPPMPADRLRARAHATPLPHRRRKIAEAGIDYEFPGFESSLPARSKKTKFEDK